MLLPPKYRQPVLLGILLLSVLCLFVSRAGLSIFTIAFIVITCAHRSLAAQCRTVLRTPVLWGMSLLFVVPLVSGLWSSDVQEWTDVIRLKLPLFFLPLAFAGNWQLDQKQWRWLGWFFLACMVGGVLWSGSIYLQDIDRNNDAFNYARSFDTPLRNDRVRFSWLTGIAAAVCVLLWNGSRRPGKLLLTLSFILFAVYLHILAARTGLVTFYAVLLLLAVVMLRKNRSRAPGIALLLVLIAAPVVALQVFPSLRNRVNYIRYDFDFVKRAAYTPGANDGNRFLSMRAGAEVMRAHPGGVGFGDIPGAMDAWYTTNIPQMDPADKIYPHNEWIVYGLGAGWAGVLLFTLAMAAPFLQRTGERAWWLLLNGTAAFSFLFDVGLEVQHGVFVYAFLILWWYKWLTPQRLLAQDAIRPDDSDHL